MSDSPVKCPQGLPFVGNFFSYVKDPIGYQLYLYEAFGDFVYINLFGKKIYLLNNPEHIKRILVTDANKVKKGMALQNAKRVIGTNILTAEKDAHIKRRKVLSKAFSAPAVQEYERFMMTYLESKTVELFNRKGTHNLVELFDEVGLEIISTILFGKSDPKINEIVSENLHIGFQIVAYLTVPFYKYLLKLPFPIHLRFRKTQKALRIEINEMVKKRNQSFSRDIVNILMEEGCSEREIYEQVLTIFMAGHETTATSLTWLFYCLGKNKYDDTRLVTELRNAQKDEAFSKDLDNYPYVKAVIYETLRLYPPVWNIGRQVLEDIDLDGNIIKKGDLVSLSPYVSQRNPNYFKKPEEFKPERWLDEGGKFKDINKFVYFPFSQGTRNCIGKMLSFGEIFQVMKAVIPKYKINMDSEFNLKYQLQFTLRPKGRILVSITKREDLEK